MADRGESSSDDGERTARRGILFRLSASPTPERRIPAVESIVHNLRAVLNSDRGISASSPTFGLSLHRALSDWDSRRPTVLADLADLIARFEPRLSDVKIVALEVKETFRFSVLITAKTADGAVFKARTNMAASGAAEVEVEELITEI